MTKKEKKRYKGFFLNEKKDKRERKKDLKHDKREKKI